MRLQHAFKPPVQPARGNPRVPQTIHLVGGGHHPVEAAPMQPRHVNHRDPAHLGKRGFQPIINLPDGGLPVAHHIPFVGADHQAAPLFGDHPRDGQILFMKFFIGIHQQQAQMRELDGAQRIIDHQPFDLVTDAGAAAHAGRIDETVGPSLPGKGKLDGITCDPGLGPGQQPVFTQQPVDQRRLAHIRASDNGDPHR